MDAIASRRSMDQQCLNAINEGERERERERGGDGKGGREEERKKEKGGRQKMGGKTEKWEKQGPINGCKSPMQRCKTILQQLARTIRRRRLPSTFYRHALSNHRYYCCRCCCCRCCNRCRRRCCRCRCRCRRCRRRRRRFTDSLPCAMMVQCASRTSALRCVHSNTFQGIFKSSGGFCVTFLILQIERP